LFYQKDWFLPSIARAGLYRHFQACAVCACLLGLIVSSWFYMRGCANAAEQAYSARNRCITVDMLGSARTATARSSSSGAKGRSPPGAGAGAHKAASSAPAPALTPPSSRSRSRSRSRGRSRSRPPPPAVPAGSDRGSLFFLGCEFNPRVLNVDVKMFLYLAGAVLLQLNLLSAVEAQLASPAYVQYANGQGHGQGHGHISLALKTYVGCFSWFLIEYLLGEQVGTAGMSRCMVR